MGSQSMIESDQLGGSRYIRSLRRYSRHNEWMGKTRRRGGGGNNALSVFFLKKCFGARKIELC